MRSYKSGCDYNNSSHPNIRIGPLHSWIMRSDNLQPKLLSRWAKPDRKYQAKWGGHWGECNTSTLKRQHQPTHADEASNKKQVWVVKCSALPKETAFLLQNAFYVGSTQVMRHSHFYSKWVKVTWSHSQHTLTESSRNSFCITNSLKIIFWCNSSWADMKSYILELMQRLELLESSQSVRSLDRLDWMISSLSLYFKKI